MTPRLFILKFLETDNNHYQNLDSRLNSPKVEHQ
mgnify:CR=1 FL=1